MTTRIHPGEVLAEEFLLPLGLTVERLAGSMGVSVDRLSGVVSGKVAIDRELAMALGRALDTTADFWTNLQSKCALDELTAEAQKLGLGY